MDKIEDKQLQIVKRPWQGTFLALLTICLFLPLISIVVIFSIVPPAVGVDTIGEMFFPIIVGVIIVLIITSPIALFIYGLFKGNKISIIILLIFVVIPIFFSSLSLLIVMIMKGDQIVGGLDVAFKLILLALVGILLGCLMLWSIIICLKHIFYE